MFFWINQPGWDLIPRYLQASLCCIALLLSTYIVGIRAVVRSAYHRKRPILPPGPSGTPIVGNLLQMRKARSDPGRLVEYVVPISILEMV